MCNRGGYCYLILFKRKYRPYAFLLYGKNPQLGDLNLSEEYRSNVFMDLNIAVNYPKKLIHVYRAKNVKYAEGFEKYKDNAQLIGNWWLPHYIVGATAVETETIRRTTTAPIITEHSSYDDGEHGESASHTIRNQGRNATDPLRPDQTYINSLMTGGIGFNTGTGLPAVFPKRVPRVRVRLPDLDTAPQPQPVPTVSRVFTVFFYSKGEFCYLLFLTFCIGLTPATSPGNHSHPQLQLLSCYSHLPMYLSLLKSPPALLWLIYGLLKCYRSCWKPMTQ
jgi:hypothetical protein